MCFDTELSEMAKGAATSVTRASPLASRERIFLRVSSARATSVSSRSACMGLIFTEKGEYVKAYDWRMKTLRFLLSLALFAAAALPAAAEDVPVPKMFRGMKEKGQWRMDMLEGAPAGKAPPSMTLCTDNLLGQDHAPAQKMKSDCKQRVLKDTADELAVERTCPGRAPSTFSVKRESAKSVLAEVHSGEKGAARTVKMRYTHLGPCREGQPSMTIDKNSEQCAKMKQAMAKMDPVKSCNGHPDRPACEKQLRDQIKQGMAMCS